MHQTLQIEDIVTPEGVTMSPSVDAAAALQACGWQLHYKKQERRTEGGKIEHAWCLYDRFSDAQDLLRRAALTGGPESLIHRVPEHPFLAALYGIASLRWLEHWYTTGTVPAAVKPSPGSRLCTLSAPGTPGDLLPLVWAAAEQTSEAVPVPCERTAAFCAAAIATGFLPRPYLTGAAVPELHLPAESFTFGGLRSEHLHQTGLPGTATFSAALRGCLARYACLRREAAERRTTLLMRALHGTGTAIISNVIWDTEDPRFAKDRDKIAEHLALSA